MTSYFVGIDIQIRRNCCYAVIDSGGTLVSSGWFSNPETDAINLLKKWNESAQIEVGIDAPRMPLISKRQWYWRGSSR